VLCTAHRISHDEAAALLPHDLQDPRQQPTPEPPPTLATKKTSSRALIPTKARALSAKEFLALADVPPEIEWFANITNP